MVSKKKGFLYGFGALLCKAKGICPKYYDLLDMGSNWLTHCKKVPVFAVLLCKSPYSVRMWENVDQKNSECGHFTQ